MKQISRLLLLCYGLTGSVPVSAQAIYQSYSFDFYQKLSPDLYSTQTRLHTSLKPFFADDSLVKHTYDSLMHYGSGNQHNRLYQKIFNGHLIDLQTTNATFYSDLLPDLGIGRDLSGNKTTWIRSLGVQMGGTVGSKFYYNVSKYVNNAAFPDYLANYINRVGVIPGQALARLNGNDRYGWTETQVIISYTPIKYLNIAAGHDKNFIGDGYRSMLLSDYASPYFFFKLTGTLGDVRYMAMWTDMNDPASTSPYHIDRRKFGVFHYLDWNVSNRLSLGFFDNVIGFFTDDNGVKRPFDFNYINPVIFMKPINNSSDDPDKSLLGFTGKYKMSNGITFYGQFALNEFHSKDFFSSNGAVDNKYGWQLGVRGANLFKIKKLNYLVETNTARPYTYEARSAIENYSDNGESLAHPLGANFREWLGILNYTAGRFEMRLQFDYAYYGLDMNGLNYGNNIFELYTSPAQPFGNYTGQGLRTNLNYAEPKLSYLINPATNLRLELGGIYRYERNSLEQNKVTWLTFGLRSSFRNIYQDF